MIEEQITAQIIATIEKERSGPNTSEYITGKVLEIIQQQEPELCPYLYWNDKTPKCGDCERKVKWAGIGKQLIETNSASLSQAVTLAKAELANEKLEVVYTPTITV